MTFPVSARNINRDVLNRSRWEEELMTVTNKQVFRRCLPFLGGILLCTVSLRAAPNKVRIIQSNSAGDSVDIIDPVTNKVVGEIKGIEVNHGVAVAPEGSRLYRSDET